ncbi:MAG: hypothetical protein H6850_02365 [Alphaproteobacteria bacterium]|nr:MAG: hypothetical protein H6850_02365 [Alphaproteobacteria bacterium]
MLLVLYCLRANQDDEEQFYARQNAVMQHSVCSANEKLFVTSRGDVVDLSDIQKATHATNSVEDDEGFSNGLLGAILNAAYLVKLGMSNDINWGADAREISANRPVVPDYVKRGDFYDYETNQWMRDGAILVPPVNDTIFAQDDQEQFFLPPAQSSHIVGIQKPASGVVISGGTTKSSVFVGAHKSMSGTNVGGRIEFEDADQWVTRGLNNMIRTHIVSPFSFDWNGRSIDVEVRGKAGSWTSYEIVLKCSNEEIWTERVKNGWFDSKGEKSKHLEAGFNRVEELLRTNDEIRQRIEAISRR